MARPQKIGIPPGGLAGQALIKSSDNDLDVTWGGPPGGGGGGGGGGGFIANGFLGRPYAVWSGTGLIFNVYWPVYYIQGIQYTSGSTSITLDAADPTNARIDVIAVNSTGGIKITGTAAAAPVKPTVDFLTQLEITEIQIAAAATTPTGIADEDVYKENLEWTGSSNVSGANFADTTSPFAGTKDTSIGSFTNGQYVQYVDGSTHDISDYTYLKFYVKIKAQFLSNTGWIITFKNGTTTVSSAFTVTNGIYAFDRTDTTGYQLVVVPLSEFTFSSATFNTIYFTLRGNNTSGFYFDNIVIQGGIVALSSLQNAITTIQTPSGAAVSDQPNDTFVFAGSGISASGKTITFTGGSGGHTIEDEGTPLTARTKLNFVGAGVTATDDAGDDASVITIPGSSITVGDTQVLFADGANNPAGEAAYTYDKTLNKLTVDNILLNGKTASRIVTTDGSKNLDTPYTFRDEDDMASDDATGIPSQQSVKAYFSGLGGDELELALTMSIYNYTQR